MLCGCCTNIPNPNVSTFYMHGQWFSISGLFVSFYVAGVESEEVEVKGFGYLLEQFAIDIGPSVNFANVAWIAVELCGEPRVFAPLSAHFASYCVANVYHKMKKGYELFVFLRSSLIGGKPPSKPSKEDKHEQPTPLRVQTTRLASPCLSKNVWRFFPIKRINGKSPLKQCF